MISENENLAVENYVFKKTQCYKYLRVIMEKVKWIMETTIGALK